MSMAARPPRKWTIVGDGIDTFGVARDDRREVPEVGDLDVADVAQRPDDGQLRRRHVDGRGGVGAGGDVAR